VEQPPSEPSTRRRTLRESSAAHKRELVERALTSHHGNLAAAARSLGMDRGNFHRLVKRLGLRD
jgi:anaerobic nitric oxide reductase transcription regulator